MGVDSRSVIAVLREQTWCAYCNTIDVKALALGTRRIGGEQTSKLGKVGFHPFLSSPIPPIPTSPER